MGDDPPYLTVGTEVSAKYKGAFCEAKVRKVVKNIKCKVLFKLGQGTALILEEHIKGPLRVGAQVEAKHPDKNQFMEATINKIQDGSQYTVVFDDGDITTLRRSALCLKSGRHFAESETLDQLPLTHPEHFGTPVVGGRRGRRSFPNQEGSSGDEDDEDPPSKNRKEDKEPDLGKLVCVEIGDKKKSKDNWFPGLIVAPTAQDTVHIRVKDEYLVRSFKDGRYYTVPKKEAVRFTREIASKVDNATLKTAVEKALLYLDKDELPPHWDRDLLFGLVDSSSSDDEKQVSEAESSDDEPREQKDHFVAQLYKFMDDRGTPINKGPTVGSKDLDLYRLFMVVHKQGGFNRVSNQNGWKSVSQKLGLVSKSANLVKQAYKKYLHGFEDFYRKLGCTMINSPRSNRNRHRSGRSLIRDKDKTNSTLTPKREDKDRETPKPSPCPAAEEEEDEVKEKTEEDVAKELPKEPVSDVPPPQVKVEVVEEEEEEVIEEKKVVKVKKVKENRDPPATEESETKKRHAREKKELRVENAPTPESGKRLIRKKKPKTYVSSDEEPEKETPAKRAYKKRHQEDKEKEDKDDKGKKKLKKGKKEDDKKDEDNQNKKKSKRSKDAENIHSDEEPLRQLAPDVEINIGDILRVYYDLGSESKVTYEAKVCDVREEGTQKMYYVHYTGWNTRYDEWIKRGRIAENVSLSSSPNKVKKTRNNKPPAKDVKVSVSSPPKTLHSGKRSRSTGTTRSDSSRSATPSSIASTSSRTAAQSAPNAGKNSSESGSSPSKAESRRRSRRVSEMSCVTESDTSGDEDAANSDEAQTNARSPRRPPRYRKQHSDSGSKGEEEDEPKDKTEKSYNAAPPAVVKEPEINKVEDNHNKEEGPKGKDFDLRKIRSELKMPIDATPPPPPPPLPAPVLSTTPVVPATPEKKDPKEAEEQQPKPVPKDKEHPSAPTAAPAPVATNTPVKKDEDIYEFREPEPFELEVRPNRKEVDARFGRKGNTSEEDSPKKTPTKKTIEREKSPLQSPVEEEEGKAASNPGLASPVPSGTVQPTKVEESNKPCPVVDAQPPKDNILSVPKDHPAVEQKLEVKEKEMLPKSVSPSVLEISSPVAKNTSPTEAKEVANPGPAYIAVKTALPTPVIVPADVSITPVVPPPASKVFPALIGSHPVVSPVTALVAASEVTEPAEISRVPCAITKPPNTSIIHLPAFIPQVMPALSALASKSLIHDPGTAIPAVPVLVPSSTTKVVVPEPSPVNLSDPSSSSSSASAILPEKIEEAIVLGPSSAKKDARKKLGKKGQPISKEFIDSDTEDSSSSPDESEDPPNDGDHKSPESAQEEKRRVSPSVEAKAELLTLPEVERPRTPTQPAKKQKLLPKSDEETTETSAESISLLLCQETIPGSPVAHHDRSNAMEEHSGLKPCELPFASTPGPSCGQQQPVPLPMPHRDNSNVPRPPRKRGLREIVAAQQRANPRPAFHARVAAPPPNVPAPAAAAVPPAIQSGAGSTSSAAVLENTPPTTPEGSPSSLSGSPVGERVGGSPERDEQSLKSEMSENDSEHSNSEPPVNLNRPAAASTASSTIALRLNGPGGVTNAVGATSRVTGVNIRRKEATEPEEATPSPLKRRKKSTPRQEGDPPPRRGRPPNNAKSPRRTGSDTEDTFETYMNQHNIAMADPNRPCRYNFCVMLDPELDANQRIAILQDKMRELRKTYLTLKTQLAVIDKRRKKLRRKERDNKALSSKSQSA